MEPYLDRGKDSRRALQVTMLQSTVNLLLFLVMFIAGAVSGLWEALFPAGRPVSIRYGAVICLIVSFLLVLLYRGLAYQILLKRYTDGLVYIKAGRFEDAIKALESHLAYLNAHPALERWRTPLLLDYGAYGLREMTLLNLALAYYHNGQANRAIALYGECLALNPNNEIALSARQAIQPILEAG
jgi:tetratricopeptide (TPR) repeat protein